MADIILNGLTSPLGKPRLADLQHGTLSVPFPLRIGYNGLIGFQAQAGVIAVTGSLADVKVSLDRPMTYDGTFAPVPGGVPFDIGQPTLSVSATSLTIPINITHPSVPSILTVSTPSPNVIVLGWDQPITLTSFGSLSIAYVIVPPLLGGPVNVTSVQLLDPTHLQLTTTDQESGAVYQLNVAKGAVENTGSVANIAFSAPFTGNNAALTITSHHLVDSTDFLITYSRPVQAATATVPSNYVFAPTLVVDLVERVTDTQYLVKTSQMQPNTIYGVTVSNVRALDGSVI